MEIGLSSDQLIEIGLNIAGFLSAGLLIAVLHSMIFKRGKKQPAVVAGKDADELPVKNSQPVKTDNNIESNIEFINLGGVNWKPPRKISKSTRELNFKDKKRQEVINLAKELIAGKNRENNTGRIHPNTGNKTVLNQDLKVQTAGRS